MNSISVILNGDGAWPDLADRDVIHLQGGKIDVAVLDGGLISGRPSVTIRIDLPDGKTVVAETTARLFVGAGRMIVARYPDLFTDTKPERH
jgi:hypothetical protein